MSNGEQLISSVILAMTGLLGAVLTYVIKKRSSIYPYDVSQDYEYEFRQTNAHVADLHLSDGKLNVAKHGNTNQTAFLKVNVRTTFMGKYFQPSIDVISGTSSCTEYLEHGARGVRYLNISPLLSNDAGEIRFEGKNVSIDDQTVQLIRFNNQETSSSRMLILAPHPDDAEIAAYGLYSSSNDSYVVTVTAGDAGWNEFVEIFQDTVKGYLKQGESRTWKSITVPLLAGIPPERVLNLGFFDGKLESMHRDKTSVAHGLHTGTSDITTYRKQNISTLSAGLYGASDWNSLVGNLEYLLRTIEPDVIVTIYPALDSHKDHKFSSIALFEAIRNSGLKKGALYLYINHFVSNEFYPYGNSGGSVSLPPNSEKTIYFDRIYSHALSADVQKDKTFALEAMDSERRDAELRSTKGAIRLAIDNLKRDIVGNDVSYFRRAVRSNELFFVVDISNIYNDETLKSVVGDL